MIVHMLQIPNIVLFIQYVSLKSTCQEKGLCIPPLDNESNPLLSWPKLQRLVNTVLSPSQDALSMSLWNVWPNWKQSSDFTTALSVSHVLPLWRPSALDLDFLLLCSLSLSFSFPFSTLLRVADWRVSPQLAWVTVGLVVFVHFSFSSLCVCVCLRGCWSLIPEQQVFRLPSLQSPGGAGGCFTSDFRC